MQNGIQYVNKNSWYAHYKRFKFDTTTRKHFSRPHGTTSCQNVSNRS